jgi:G3E family GTPase
VAEPAPVIRPFYNDVQLRKIYQFNGTVCLVDAINFDKLPNMEIALKQIAAADCVLVNKSDAVDNDKRRQNELKIKEVNPLAEIYISEFGDTNEFNLNSINKINYVPDLEKHSPVLLDTKTLVFEKPLYLEDFKQRFSYLFDINKTKIYRVKGILNFADEPYEYILHGVGGSFELTEGENLKSSNKSQIVLIGRLLDADLIM